MEEYFDDIIEEAVSLEIETEHKAASDEMLHQISDPDVPNNYDFMLVIGLRIDNEEIPEETQSIYLKFCRTIKCIVDTIFSESEHGIYVEKRQYMSKDRPFDINPEDDKTNDYIIQNSPLIFRTNKEPYAFDSIINTTLHGWPGAYYLTYYKFSILNNREPKLLMLNFFRLFYNIEAYLRQRIDKLTFEKSRRVPGVDMKTFVLKNKDNIGWIQPSRSGIVTETIFPLFDNAPLYKKNDENKVIFYYKDLFEPNASIERVRELTQIFKDIMLERGNIKRRANCKRYNITPSFFGVASS